MKKRGYSTALVEDTIKRAVASGQANDILELFEMEVPAESKKLHRKYLKAAENFTINGTIVHDVRGVSFNGIASWGNLVTVRMNHHDYRYRLFNLDRFERRSVFLVPIGLASSFKSLPGIDLSQAEIGFIKEMADTLKGKKTAEEILLHIEHPAKACIHTQTAAWDRISFDREKLLSLLKQNPGVLMIATAAMDTQLRGIKRLDAVPPGIYNFVLPGGESDTEKWFNSALNAMTFSNETGAFGSGPIEIRLKDSADLAKCENGMERMVLVRTASGALLWPLLEHLEKQEQIRKARGLQTPSLTPPLVLSKGYLHCQQAADILLPKKLGVLNVESLNILRAAMSHVINKTMAKTLCGQLEYIMQSNEAYHLSSFRVWSELLLTALIEIWFSNGPLYTTARSLLENTEAQQRKEEARRKEILHKAFTLLSHPQKYRNEIIDRPASKADAVEQLATDAVAFQFVPCKGIDYGTELLAFTQKSLLRLLARVDCGEEFYDAFLYLCEANGVLDQRNRTVKLGDATINVITFSLEK